MYEGADHSTEEKHLLFEFVVREGIRMRALAEESLLGQLHFDVSMTGLLRGKATAVFFALLALDGWRSSHFEWKVKWRKFMSSQGRE
jgi:hypothetical protein